MAAAAVAAPPTVLPHTIPDHGVINRPSTTSTNNSVEYTDPTTAKKTAECPIKEKLIPQPPGPNQIYKQEGVTYGDWRDDLVRDGYVVIKGVIPRERALAYGDEFFDYLENFAGGLGFKRDDISTVLEKNLPVMNEKGMIFGYGINHEATNWNIRQEPGVISVFEKLHDTPDLLVSFDGVNVQWPNRPDQKPNTPWPHQDQDPKTASQFRCMQGLVNILPNGPDDGGLYVCKGFRPDSGKFHELFKDEPDRIWSWTHEWYGFTEAGMKWIKDNGYEWVKPCAEPGDFILWDSRTPHYNLVPTGKSPRLAFYTCFGPASEATQEQLKGKKRAMMESISTTHWPNALHVGGLFPERDGKRCQYDTGKPRKTPELTERGWKLTGIPYLQEE